MPVIFAGGRERRLTAHVVERIEERSLSVDWIIQTINNPVAVINDERKNSMNYYGVIEGFDTLFKVAVSKRDDRAVATAHFDSATTRRYQRGEL